MLYGSTSIGGEREGDASENATEGGKRAASGIAGAFLELKDIVGTTACVVVDGLCPSTRPTSRA